MGKNATVSALCSSEANGAVFANSAKRSGALLLRASILSVRITVPIAPSDSEVFATLDPITIACSGQGMSPTFEVGDSTISFGFSSAV